MVKESIIRALLAGVIYTILIWLGDLFFFKQETPYYILIIQGLIFTIVMSVVYYFSLKKQNKQNNK